VPTLTSGLTEVVVDDEDLARLLASSSLFNSVMVKPAAFMPNPKDGETSVFRHGSEPRDSLWQLARDHAIGERTLHGAAIITTRRVREVDPLDVVASEPPPRHANIRGWAWSADDPDMGKAERKEQAARIAQHAEFVRA